MVIIRFTTYIFNFSWFTLNNIILFHVQFAYLMIIYSQFLSSILGQSVFLLLFSAPVSLYSTLGFQIHVWLFDTESLLIGVLFIFISIYFFLLFNSVWMVAIKLASSLLVISSIVYNLLLIPFNEFQISGILYFLFLGFAFASFIQFPYFC